MRRALAGIVPDEILNRRRKAFVDRGPRVAIHAARSLDSAGAPLSSAIGVVNAKAFCETLEKVQSDQEIPIVGLMRTLTLEMWLKNLICHGLLTTHGKQNETRQPWRLARDRQDLSQLRTFQSERR